MFPEEQFYRVGHGRDLLDHSFKGQSLNFLVRVLGTPITAANTAFSGEGDEGADVRHFCATVDGLFVFKQRSGTISDESRFPERGMVTIIDSA